MNSSPDRLFCEVESVCMHLAFLCFYPEVFCVDE